MYAKPGDSVRFLAFFQSATTGLGVTGLTVKVAVNRGTTSVTGVAVSDSVSASVVDATNQPGLYYYDYTVPAAYYGPLHASFTTTDTTVIQRGGQSLYFSVQWLEYLDAAITSRAAATALQTVDDEIEVMAINAATASAQASAANAKFGGILSTAGNQLDDWLLAIAADGATAPSAMSGAGYDPTTDSLEAIRNRGDAAWVTGGGASVQNIFEADPADYDADADSFAARVLAILAKANQITGPFAYKGPVSATGRVTIYQGKDYNATDGTALEWTSDSALTGLDAVGASVSFDINGDQYAGVVSGSVGAWTIRVNLTAAQTAALPVGDSPYELTAVLASGRTPPPLAVGTVTVKAEV